MGLCISLLSLAMTMSLLTLNTGGCSALTQNASFQVYIDQISSNPDLVLLQETYNLNESSPCWNMWSYTPYCSPGPTRGSGVTTLVKNTDIEVISSCSVFHGYILYTKINFNNTLSHLQYSYPSIRQKCPPSHWSSTWPLLWLRWRCHCDRRWF